MLDTSASPDPAAEIARLDPRVDYERIAFLLTNQLFPLSIEKALEYALFKTYAIPSISRILAATGEFSERAQKRYDDTVLLLAEIGENGEGKPEGEAALRRMNEIHARFRIRNEDYLYTLSAFVFEPIRFLRLYGPRPLTENEAEGWFHAYVALGRRMGLQNLPEDRETFFAWRTFYEAAEMRAAPENRVVADATVAVLLDMAGAPRFARKAATRVVVAAMEPHVAEAFGYEPPSPMLLSAVEAALKARGAILRIWPGRRRLRLQSRRKLPTYPRGYQIGMLGPEPYAYGWQKRLNRRF